MLLFLSNQIVVFLEVSNRRLSVFPCHRVPFFSLGFSRTFLILVHDSHNKDIRITILNQGRDLRWFILLAQDFDLKKGNEEAAWTVADGSVAFLQLAIKQVRTLFSCFLPSSEKGKADGTAEIRKVRSLGDCKVCRWGTSGVRRVAEIKETHHATRQTLRYARLHGN